MLVEYGFILKEVRKLQQKKIDGRFSFEGGHQIANKFDSIFVVVSPIVNAIFIALFFPISYLSGIRNSEI